MTQIDLGDVEDPESNAEVTLPSGASFHVHESERDYFVERVERYLRDNSFTNVADLQDLDRVLIGELLIFRWGGWLARQRNYFGEPVDEQTLQKAIKEISAELRQVKSALALDKISRDRQRGEDSVPAFIAELQTRAKHFGYKRNREFEMAMELWQKLRSLIVFHDNCTPEERREQKVQPDHIFEWLRNEAFPAYDEIDRKFRKEGSLITRPDGTQEWLEPQSMWIREQ